MEETVSNRSQAGWIIVLNAEGDFEEQSIKVAKAVASQPRLKILAFLLSRAASVSEISNELSKPMPIATASMHLSNLEEAGLISSQISPGKRGQGLSSITIDDLSLTTQPFISVSIGIDDNAVNKGGLNIFGTNLATMRRILL